MMIPIGLIWVLFFGILGYAFLFWVINVWSESPRRRWNKPKKKVSKAVDKIPEENAEDTEK